MVTGIILNTLRKSANTVKRAIQSEKCCSVFVSNPAEMVSEGSGFAVPKLFKPLTKKEINNIKPSEFSELLASRKDIPESIYRVEGNKVITSIQTPEQLALYDKVRNMLLEGGYDLDYINKCLTFLIQQGPARTEAQTKIIPKLLKKGYNPELLAQLQIDQYNYKYVEKFLEKEKFLQQIQDEHVNKIWEEKLQDAIGSAKLYSNCEILTENKIKTVTEKTRKKFLSEENQLRIQKINSVLRGINKDNINHLEEWYKLSGDIWLLEYWTKYSKQIYTDFISKLPSNSQKPALEIISRRKLSYKDIQQIFTTGKITEGTYSLLEYKNFEKFKDIDLSNFDTLSVKEKKEFINSYICCISPNQLISSECVEKTLKSFYTGAKERAEMMKIYKNIDLSTPEKFNEGYYKTLKTMLDSLPDSERSLTKIRADWGDYNKTYRKNNPIPALTDDIAHMPYTTEIINGKEYKIIDINTDTAESIANHCIWKGDSILNLEALEITDPNIILCIGLKGNKSNWVHYNKKGYAVAMKPRNGGDWWMQYSGDFDSGTTASKNIAGVSRFLRGVDDTQRFIPELIKKELNLSQKEYSKRMKKLSTCRTLDEIGKIDKEMENGIRGVLTKNRTYEGILCYEPMGVCIDSTLPLGNINQNILNYCERRNIPILRVHDVRQKIDMGKFKFVIEL